MSDIETREIRIDLKPQIKEILEETGKKCAEKIRANSPIGRSGEYSRGWTYEINDDLSVTVKNTGKHKTLGHLLEYGHLSKAKKRIPPQEHVRPAYNVCKIEYLEKLKKIEIK